jgi:hypothetical protein
MQPIKMRYLTADKHFTGRAETNDGDHTAWYKDGKLHRDGDLPALIHRGKLNEYYQDGRRHRVNGPAMEWLQLDGENLEGWYLNGKEYRTEALHAEAVKADHGIKDMGHFTGKIETANHTAWFIDGKECTETEHKELLDS